MGRNLAGVGILVLFQVGIWEGLSVEALSIRPAKPWPIGADVWLNAMPTARGTVAPQNPQQPIQEYHTRTARGRVSPSLTVVEWVYATVTAANLGRGTATNAAVRTFARDAGRATDDAGHIIGKNQGGLGTVNWNIFPQNPNINRGVFATDVEKNVNDAVSAGGVVQIWFRLYYGTAEPGRPTSINYYIQYPNGSILNSNIVNP